MSYVADHTQLSSVDCDKNLWFAGVKAALWWPYIPSRTVKFFILWFWVLYFKGIFKKLCILRISGERDLENISAHAPRKYTCQKKRKVRHALDFCFNKFTLSRETQVLRKTTFVTFCSWNCLSNAKGFITLRAGAFFPAERGGKIREVSLSVPWFHCFSTSLWPLFKNWNLANTRIHHFRPSTEANLRVTASLHVWLVIPLTSGVYGWRCGWEPAECSSVSQTRLQQRRSGSSLIRLQQYWFSTYRDHECSCILFFALEISASARLLHTHLIVLWRRGWDSETASALYAPGKWQQASTLADVLM